MYNPGAIRSRVDISVDMEGWHGLLLFSCTCGHYGKGMDALPLFLRRLVRVLCGSIASTRGRLQTKNSRKCIQSQTLSVGKSFWPSIRLKIYILKLILYKCLPCLGKVLQSPYFASCWSSWDSKVSVIEAVICQNGQLCQKEADSIWSLFDVHHLF